MEEAQIILERHEQRLNTQLMIEKESAAEIIWSKAEQHFRPTLDKASISVYNIGIKDV